MARREWPLRFQCGHEGCPESANFRYQTRRELVESFELKHYSNGRWRCVRHARPDELLSAENRQTRIELTVEQQPHGRYFGNFGFISGPGFRAFAKDFPAGAKVIVSAELVLPSCDSGSEAKPEDPKRSEGAEHEVSQSGDAESGASPNPNTQGPPLP